MDKNQLTAIAKQDPNLLIEEITGQRKLVIYQIFTRLFGNTKATNALYGTLEENGVGKFNDITETALKAIKAMGSTHVWYTGVVEHAVLTDYQQYDIPLDDADVVKGRAGSPYAIKDYYDVNPDLAVEVPNRMQEFEALVARTHAQELKVIIDFVPNHVARHYHSDVKPEGVFDFGEDDDVSKAFDPHNNFYYIPDEHFQVPQDYVSLSDHPFPTKDGKFAEYPAKATGNDNFSARPTINDWFETVKLNYGVDYLHNRQHHFDPVPDTWQKMYHVLRYWAGKQVNGFRCDMAEMVPVEFWQWVIPKVKEQYPNLVFIAEIYNPEQYRNYIDVGRFDFLYDKVQTYDTLRGVIEGHGTLISVENTWKYLYGKNQHMLRFLENHDEQRIASRFFAGAPEKAKPGMVLSALMHTGPLMVYFGQEVGEPALGTSGFSGDDGRTTIFDYWGVPEFQKWSNGGKFDGADLSPQQRELRTFYQQLMNLCHHEAISHGMLYDLFPHNRHLAEGFGELAYAFLRFTQDKRLLVVMNFDAKNPQKFNLKIPKTAIEAMGMEETKDYQLTDIFQTNTTATFRPKDVIISEGPQGIAMELAPLQSYVFEISQVY